MGRKEKLKEAQRSAAAKSLESKQQRFRQRRREAAKEMKSKSTKESHPVEHVLGREARADSIQSCTIEWSRRIYRKPPNENETKSEGHHELDEASIVSTDPLFRSKPSLWILAGQEQPEESAMTGRSIIARLKQSADTGKYWPSEQTSTASTSKPPAHKLESALEDLATRFSRLSISSPASIILKLIVSDDDSCRVTRLCAHSKARSATRKSKKNKAQRARKRKNKRSDSLAVSGYDNISKSAAVTEAALMSGARLPPRHAERNKALSSFRQATPGDNDLCDEHLQNVETPSSSHGKKVRDSLDAEGNVDIRDNEGWSARTNPPPKKANPSRPELVARTRKLIIETLKEVDLRTTSLERKHQKENLEHFIRYRVLKHAEDVSRRYLHILMLEAAIERLCIVEEPFRVDPCSGSDLPLLVTHLLERYADPDDGPLAQMRIALIELSIRLSKVETGQDRMWQRVSEEDKTHLQSLRNIHHEVVKSIVEDLQNGQDVNYVHEMEILIRYLDVLKPKLWYHFVGIVGGDTQTYIKALAAACRDETLFTRYFGKQRDVNNMIIHTARLHSRGTPNYIRQELKELANRQIAGREAKERRERETESGLEAKVNEAAEVKPLKTLASNNQGGHEVVLSDTHKQDLDSITCA